MTAAPSSAPPGRFMSRGEVEAQTTLSRTTIWRRIKEGTFPKAIPLGGQKVGWDENEIAEWKAARKAERDPPGG